MFHILSGHTMYYTIRYPSLLTLHPFFDSRLHCGASHGCVTRLDHGVGAGDRLSQRSLAHEAITTSTSILLVFLL
jgi:hypothetical protein